MTNLPTDRIVVANGDYQPSRRLSVGRVASIEISGTFGGATVVPGYVSEAGAFVADGAGKTAAGRWDVRVPKSGYPAVNVAAASGTTAIKVGLTLTKA